MIRLKTVDWRWVLRLAGMLLALAILPIVLGILLDVVLHTAPIITLFMMLLGFNLGVFTIARSVAAVYSRYSVSDNQSPTIGGDQC